MNTQIIWSLKYPKTQDRIFNLTVLYPLSCTCDTLNHSLNGTVCPPHLWLHLPLNLLSQFSESPAESRSVPLVPINDFSATFSLVCLSSSSISSCLLPCTTWFCCTCVLLKICACDYFLCLSAVLSSGIHSVITTLTREDGPHPPTPTIESVNWPWGMVVLCKKDHKPKD